MQVRHLPNRDHRNGGVTTLKCASAHVPRFLTGSSPPISHRQLPFGHNIAQAVTTAHRRAAARNGFLTPPSPLAAAGLPCEDDRSPVPHLHEDPTSNYHAGVSEPTCSGSKARRPNQRLLVVASNRWSLRCAQHQGETHLCISLPFLVSFIANIARKRPEQNRGKTTSCPSRHRSAPIRRKARPGRYALFPKTDRRRAWSRPPLPHSTAHEGCPPRHSSTLQPEPELCQVSGSIVSPHALHATDCAPYVRPSGLDRQSRLASGHLFGFKP